MFCKKCGNQLNEGSAFCGKCGAQIDNNNASQQPSAMNAFIKKLNTPIGNSKSARKPSKQIQPAARSPFSSKLRNLVLHYSRHIIFALQILTCGWILGMMDSSVEYHLKDIGLDPRVMFNISVFTAIAIILLSMGYNLKNRNKEQHYCPKCKKEAIHNKYGVCTDCYLDTSANNIMFLFFFVLTYAFYVGSGFVNEFDVFFILAFALISMGLSVIYPIYMYPAKLARRTGHVAATAIYVLNLLLGGTVILWIVLLIWASGGNGNKREVIIQAPTEAQKSSQEKFAEIKQLLDMGVITQEEFDEKRKEILSKI